jgi:hypothetical protein
MKEDYGWATRPPALRERCSSPVPRCEGPGAPLYFRVRFQTGGTHRTDGVPEAFWLVREIYEGHPSREREWLGEFRREDGWATRPH